MAATPAFVPIGVDAPAPLDESARAALAGIAPPAAIASAVGLLRRPDLRIDRLTCPDLLEQLLATATRPIDTILCSLLDADPALRLNAAVAQGFGPDLWALLDLLGKALGAARTLVVADAAAPRPGGWLGRRSADRPRLITIDHAYPQLHPSLLLPLTLKRRLMPGRLPVEQGVVLLDASAAWTLSRLLHPNRAHTAADAPLIPVGVCDHRTGRSRFAAVAAEITVGEVLRTLGLPLGRADALYAGALLLRRPADPLLPVGRSENTFHVAGVPEAANAAPEPCIRCGWCADVCPSGVIPTLALEAVQAGASSSADRSNAATCVTCGLCDFVCPSRLPLLDAVRRVVGRQNERSARPVPTDGPRIP